MQKRTESSGIASSALKVIARLPSYSKSFGNSDRKVSTRFVVQMKYIEYWLGLDCFQAIRIVLPDFVSVVKYAGSPHFKVSSMVPTPEVSAATAKISSRRFNSFDRIPGGYPSNVAATAWLPKGFIFGTVAWSGMWLIAQS